MQISNTRGKITLPVETIITFNKNGIVKSEPVRTMEFDVNQNSVEVLLGLLGTTPEEVVNGTTEMAEVT